MIPQTVSGKPRTKSSLQAIGPQDSHDHFQESIARRDPQNPQEEVELWLHLSGLWYQIFQLIPAWHYNVDGSPSHTRKTNA